MFIKRYIALTTATLLSVTVVGNAHITEKDNKIEYNNIELTLSDALQILNAHNNTIKQADNAVEMAKATNQKLNALWFPHLSASGMYAHMSQNIESRNNMGKLISEDGNVLTPIKEALGGSLPTSQELALRAGADHRDNTKGRNNNQRICIGTQRLNTNRSNNRQERCIHGCYGIMAGIYRR